MNDLISWSAVAEWFCMVYNNYFTVINVCIAIAVLYLLTFIIIMVAHGTGSNFVRLSRFDRSLKYFFKKYGAVNRSNNVVFRKFCVAKLPYSLRRSWIKSEKKQSLSSDEWNIMLRRKAENTGVAGLIIFFVIYVLGVVMLSVLSVFNVNGNAANDACVSITMVSGSIQLVAIAYQLYYLSNKHEGINRDIIIKFRNSIKSKTKPRELPTFDYSFTEILKKTSNENLVFSDTDNVSLLRKMIDNVIAEGVSCEMITMLVDGLRSLLSTGYVSPAEELRISCLVHDIESKNIPINV